ncbi:MAG: PQQ-binding-like beta-propeller repeat protein [Rhodococcus sp. (in: high G+C Gram-positive bacteria)]|jgi:hypothetical protein|uniref:PQQ-binding-like beta-propeller repeat protein n=1 Tax=Rhodococcus sp. EPR-157 TaxID=1813677 RepID=UPI0007BB4E66|nr:PQQ-binding-like beta-propeller repeat protein [Rhodococcus sp. EPR-157]KZF12653.1 hypothetical protein A2J03_17425 [Rhodococcus sp. EPR-157]
MNDSSVDDTSDRHGLRAQKLRTAAAVVVAVVAVAAAVLALSRGDVENPPVSEAEFPSELDVVTTTVQTSGPIHTPAWSADARSAYGREFAAFRSPAAGLMFDSGAYGVVDGGDVLVAAMGLPNPRSYSLDDVELVGIDVSDGAVKWSASPGGIDSCASRPARGELLCLDPYSDAPAVVAVSVADGAIRRIPLPDGWFPFAIESDGDSVYILEGNPEDSESVLHGGTVDALADAWSLPIESFAPWEGVEGTLIHVDDERGVVTLGGEAEFFETGTGAAVGDLELRSETSVVDTGSGDEVWQLRDPYATEISVGQTRYAQSGDSITAADIGTGDIEWTWPLPTGSDGFPASGSIVEAESGVYFLDSDSIVQLERT